jgi:hypothetical protein
MASAMGFVKQGQGHLALFAGHHFDLDVSIHCVRRYHSPAKGVFPVPRFRPQQCDGTVVPRAYAFGEEGNTGSDYSPPRAAWTMHLDSVAMLGDWTSHVCQ